MSLFLPSLSSTVKHLLCLGMVVLSATACDRFVKSGGQNDYPNKPYQDAYSGSPNTSSNGYVQPADVSDICTAGPKTRSGNPSSYKVLGKWYKVMPSACGYSEVGLASWYGPGFHGKRTSSGERYDMHAMTAAHKTLPIPARVRVTNLDNGKSLILRVNDRGPFHKGRIIDLSKTAAKKLGVLAKGTARVRVTVVDRPPNKRRAKAPLGSKPAQVAQASVYKSKPTPSGSAGGETVETFAISDETAPVSVSDNLGAPFPSVAANGVTKNTIYIQVGSFANQINAERLKARLEADSIQNVRLHPITVNGVLLNRVRVGGLSTTSRADQLAQHLKNLGYSTQQIVVDD